RVEIRRVWKLDIDIRRQETVFPHDLVQDEVQAAVGQPLSYKAWRTDVIMLNEEGAHLAESSFGSERLARLPMATKASPFVRCTARPLSARRLGRYRSYPNKYGYEHCGTGRGQC